MLTAESKCRLRRVEKLEAGTTQISPAVSLASNTQGVVKSTVDAVFTERARVVNFFFFGLESHEIKSAFHADYMYLHYIPRRGPALLAKEGGGSGTEKAITHNTVVISSCTHN